MTVTAMKSEAERGMKIYLPGFPAGISDPIELPDIGELLMYPQFQVIGADDYRRYATDFQKFLLDKLPLRHDKKNVLIRSGVWLLEPRMRSHVVSDGNWHIDGLGPYDHLRPQERVHILSSPCKSLTEFNANPLEIDSDPQETRHELTKRIRENPSAFGVLARAIEPCRIYTFENHLHRAVEPPRIEFRFFLRVRESDEAPGTNRPLQKINLTDIESGVNRIHIAYREHGVLVKYPRTLAAAAGMTNIFGEAKPN